MRIMHAKIYPMDTPLIADGYLDVQNGVITALGNACDAPPTADEVYDAGGAWMFPGFVDAHTHLGLWEDSLGFEGDDGNEDTDPATPHLSALDAVNPCDRYFEDARRAGVTTVVTGPGSANPIGGQMCAIKTAGRCVDEMAVKTPVAMKMALGENPKTSYHEKNQAPVTRMATAAIIREQLNEAKQYGERLKNAETDEDADAPDYNAKCEALLPVLSGELPVHFHAHRLDDIFTAMRIAGEFSLRYVIVHGTAGHKAADMLAAAGTQVLCGPILSERCKPELQELTAKNPAILYHEGVEVAIVTDHPVVPLEYLPLCAALAVREGMPHDAALEAITIVPARICGIDRRVGSLTVGKDADLVLFAGDPLDVRNKPIRVMISGEWV